MAQSAQYIDAREKVTVCLACKTIRFSTKKSLECDDCGGIRSLWEQHADFVEYVKRFGLKGYRVDATVKGLLVQAGLIKVPGGK